MQYPYLYNTVQEVLHDLEIRIRIRIILGRRIRDLYPHQRSEKPDPDQSQKVDPDPRQSYISAALAAQNGAMKGRKSLFGGVEPQHYNTLMRSKI